MSLGGGLGRLAVFLAFGAAAVAAVPLARLGTPPDRVPGPAELEELDGRMAREARLHPRAEAPPPPGTAAFCRECHPAVPHPGTGIAAAMHNGHAQLLDCLLCHWSAAAGVRPPAAWQRWSPQGRPGRERDLLALFPPAAGSRDELARIRARATAGQKCFSRGPGCGDCHRPGGLRGLVRPSTSAPRAAALERLEDYLRLPPGGKWYFPQQP